VPGSLPLEGYADAAKAKDLDGYCNITGCVLPYLPIMQKRCYADGAPCCTVVPGPNNERLRTGENVARPYYLPAPRNRGAPQSRRMGQRVVIGWEILQLQGRAGG